LNPQSLSEILFGVEAGKLVIRMTRGHAAAATLD
jgi:hypothetical protein